jgi:hypothetical protein
MKIKLRRSIRLLLFAEVILLTLLMCSGCAVPRTSTITVVLPGSTETLQAETVTTVVSVPGVTVTVTAPATGSPEFPSTTPGGNPLVVVTYTGTFTLQEGLGYVLLVDMTIENKGYASFDTSPSRFWVTVANARYYYSAVGSDLPTTILPDGGIASGRLAFPVPSGALSGKVGYNLAYSGTQVYNIQWYVNTP